MSDKGSVDLASLLQSLKGGDLSCLNKLPEDEYLYVLHALHEMNVCGESHFSRALDKEDYEEIPVDIDEFLENERYMGRIGVDVYPVWRTELRSIFGGPVQKNEHIIRGGVGTGKTTVGVIEIMYICYKVFCLRDPQKHLGQVQGSSIVIGFFNLFKYLSKSTAFRLFNNWLKISPFFKDIIPRRYHSESFRDEYVDLAKGVTIALGSNAIHALSQNLLCGILDEADIKKNKSIVDEEKTQIEDLYGQVKTRTVTRFLQRGGYNPSLLVLISQVKDTSAFLSTHVDKVKNDPTAHVSAFPLWVVKENVFVGESTFKVAIGSKTLRSFIVDDAKPLPDNMQIIDVPISLRPRFEYDVDDAIRDIAGIPTYGYRLLLPRRDKLFDCYKNSIEREYPFTMDSVTLSIDDNVQVGDYFKISSMFVESGVNQRKPMFYPGNARAVHVDLAKNGDACGIACGCFGDIQEVTRFDGDGRPFVIKDYKIFIDFVLRIKAKPGSEIDFSKVRLFIFMLKRLGLPIRWISYDQYGSVDSQQTFKKEKFEVKQLSVDKNVDPYYCLKATIMEERLDVLEHLILTTELTQLQDNSDIKGYTPKIDHPKHKGASKDVSDGLCGVVFRLSSEKALVAGTLDGLDKYIIEKINEDMLLKQGDWVKSDVDNSNPFDKMFGD